MLRYFVILFILAEVISTYGYWMANSDNDQELVMALTVNRHGERTPDEDELSLSDKQEALKNFTYLDGLEGLTNVGKRRAYQIGKFLKERYGPQGHKLLSNLYIASDIFIRSTDKDRTKMTAQVAMAAVYPPEVEQQWDEGVGKVWQAIPYKAVPLSQDFLRYYSNCQRFKELMAEAKVKSLTEEFLPYADLIPLIQSNTGRNFTEDPTLFQVLFDLYRSQEALGLGIPSWAKEVLPKLKEAARVAYRLYYRNDEMKKIGGGVLLSKFLELASKYSTKTTHKRLYMFSAHDFNLGSLMEVTKVAGIPQDIPEYGSLFALELYKSKSTGKLSVLPVYLPQAGEASAKVLHFTGCQHEKYCEFNKFTQQTKEFVLNEKDYIDLCHITLNTDL